MKTSAFVAERGGGGVVLVTCSYKFLLTFYIRLCSYSIESFILSKLFGLYFTN